MFDYIVLDTHICKYRIGNLEPLICFSLKYLKLIKILFEFLSFELGLVEWYAEILEKKILENINCRLLISVQWYILIK